MTPEETVKQLSEAWKTFRERPALESHSHNCTVRLTNECDCDIKERAAVTVQAWRKVQELLDALP